MAVSADSIRAFRAFEKEMEAKGYQSGEDLSALTSLPELMAYVFTRERFECGGDDVQALDHVEFFVRVSGWWREELRDCEAVLRPLGYDLLADRLRQLSLRAKRKPARSDRPRRAI